MTVTEGDGFEVTFFDLPGAGYTWTPREVPSGLTLVDTQATAATAEMEGAAQRKAVRFRADQAGDYELVFIFARSWEKKAAETTTIRVHVRPPEPQEAP